MLNRAELLLDANISRVEIAQFLTDLAGVLKPVDPHYLWRPQLHDPGDEMVLEIAVDGRADALVTQNIKDIGAAPGRFGIELWTRQRLCGGYPYESARIVEFAKFPENRS